MEERSRWRRESGPLRILGRDEKDGAEGEGGGEDFLCGLVGVVLVDMVGEGWVRSLELKLGASDLRKLGVVCGCSLNVRGAGFVF